MALTLNANALVDLNSTKGFLKIPLSVVTSDELVRDFINEISSLIESYCNRKFRSQTYIELHNGARKDEILLSQWPVNSITNLWVDPDRIFDAAALIPASNYGIQFDTMGEGISVLRYDTIFPRGKANVKIEYVAGYTDFSDIPGDLQIAAKRAIGYYYKQQQNQDFTETAKSKGDENITLIDGLPKAVTLILDNYKRLEMQAPPEAIRNV